MLPVHVHFGRLSSDCVDFSRCNQKVTDFLIDIDVSVDQTNSIILFLFEQGDSVPLDNYENQFVLESQISVLSAIGIARRDGKM